jgi:filamentous hemagglutinin
VDGFQSTLLSATEGIRFAGTGGLSTAGDLTLEAPLLIGDRAAKSTITAAGDLRFARLAGVTGTTLVGGLGADLTLRGGSISIDSDISLPSGRLNVLATSGDLAIGMLADVRINLDGSAIRFLDVTKPTDAGSIVLSSETGSVQIFEKARLSVAATAGGDAGSLSVLAPNGEFTLLGSIKGSAAGNGLKGGFLLDAKDLPGGQLDALDVVLGEGGFDRIRDYRFRNGDVVISGEASAGIYRVAADTGSIVVNGRIDASGATGGVIELMAHGNVILEDGGCLTPQA